MSRLWAREATDRRGDGGFTLIEVLIAGALALVLGSLVLSTMLAADQSIKATSATTDLSAEARLVLNRLAGDLRQAKPLANNGVQIPAITAVQNPFPSASWSANAVTSITFDADYDGNGCVAGVVSDNCPNPAPALDPNNPEIETFCWNPANKQLYLIAGTVATGTCTPSNGSVAQPLLSGQVSGFQVEYDSNAYLYDTNHDGVTTWQELDAAGPPIGNGNGVLDTTELTRITSVTIRLTVSEGSHTATFQTLVSLRNVS